MEIRNVYTVSFSGASLSVEDKIRRAYAVGIKSFRINLKTFSRIERIDELVDAIIDTCGDDLNDLLIDLPYPYEKTRTTKVSGEYSIDVMDGEELYIIGEHSDFDTEGNKAIWIEESFFEGETEVGKECMYGDGEGILKIVAKLRDDVLKARVIGNFVLLRSKSISASKEKKAHPSSQETEKLKNLFAIGRTVWVCLSFVQNAGDIAEACGIFDITPDRVIAKIENERGVNQIDSILDSCAGIMIARGDLGMNVPMTKLYEIQNYLAQKAKEKGKKLYIATDVMGSLYDRIIPCRSDIIDLSVLCGYMPDGIIYKAHALNSDRIEQINSTLCSFTEKWSKYDN